MGGRGNRSHGGGGGAQQQFTQQTFNQAVADDDAKISAFMSIPQSQVDAAGFVGIRLQLGQGTTWSQDEFQRVSVKEGKGYLPYNGICDDNDAYAIVYKDGSKEYFVGGDDMTGVKKSQIKAMVYYNDNDTVICGNSKDFRIERYNDAEDWIGFGGWMDYRVDVV